MERKTTASDLEMARESGKEETGRYLNALTDFGFKKIFMRKEVMTAFLTDLLRPSTPIYEITYLDKEMPGEFVDERGMVYDLRCQTADGKEFIVEMQCGGQKFFTDRIIYYLSRSFSSQQPKGKEETDETDPETGEKKKKEWNYHLTPVYGIFFMNFHLDGLKPRPVRTIQLKVKETGEVFSDKVRAYTLELGSYRGKAESHCKTKIDFWLYNLSNMQDMKELAFIKQQPAFRYISDEAELAKLTSEEREQYQRALERHRTNQAIIDYQYERGLNQGIKQGVKQGVEQGIAQGIEQGKIDTAKAMKEKGILVEVIAECTGLSIETINQL